MEICWYIDLDKVRYFIFIWMNYFVMNTWNHEITSALTLRVTRFSFRWCKDFGRFQQNRIVHRVTECLMNQIEIHSLQKPFGGKLEWNEGIRLHKRNIDNLKWFCKSQILDLSNVFNCKTNFCFITCQKSNYWLRVSQKSVQIALTYSRLHRCLNRMMHCCEIFYVNCENMWYTDVMFKIWNLTTHLKIFIKINS